MHRNQPPPAFSVHVDTALFPTCFSLVQVSYLELGKEYELQLMEDQVRS
jgi:hypothetical protein